MTTFLNREDVKAALGVPSFVTYQQTNMNVKAAFNHEQMRSEAATVAKLLENGVRVLIYAGDTDIKNNWIG